MAATAQTLDYPEIREAVVRLCEDFPGEYWRALDREGRYPDEFVRALTENGYLAVLIPEEYGGAGLPLSAAAAILEEMQRAGCNGAACHAQMYTMGTVLRHGSEAQKRRYLPEIAAGELRLQAFGVTEPTSRHGHHGPADHGQARGRPYVVAARRSGPRAPSTPTSCCCSRAPRRAIRSRSARRGCRSFWSTCARRSGTGSPSGRSAP